MKHLYIALLLTLFAGCNRGPHRLEYAPQPGATYKQQISYGIATLQTINGQQLSTGNKLEMFTRYTVQTGTDSVIQLRSTYEAIGMETTIDTLNATFSSGNVTDTLATLQNLNPLLALITNNPMLLSVNRQGEILHTSGFREIEHNMGRAFSANRFVKSQLLDLMRQSFGDKALAGMYGYFTRIYPSEPVRKGDSWTISRTAHTGGLTFDTEGTYTLKKVWKKKATIECSGTLHGIPHQNETFTVNMNSRTSLSGTYTGVFECDMETGYVLSGHITQQLEGTVHAVYTDTNEQIDMPFTSTITLAQKAVQ